MSDSRFSTSPAKFTIQINVLDKLQNSQGTPPNAKKYMDWNWTAEENAYVSLTMEKANSLFNIIRVKRSCPPETRDEMKVLIKDFMAFDHGRVAPHHLLDKIADFGTLLDCETVGVKRGTPMAKTPSHGGDPLATKMLVPMVSLRSSGPGQHRLTVVNPDTPESRALPGGIKSARVYRFIGTEPPAKLSQYESIGNAKRGLFLSQFADIEPPAENKKLYAWYIARYETTRSVVGDPCSPVKAEILLLTP